MVPESGSSRDISSRRKNFKTRKSKPSLPFSSWLQNTFEKWASLVTQTVKNLSAMWETHAQSLGQEDALEKGMATHSSTENSMDRSLASNSLWGCKELDTTEQLTLPLVFTFEKYISYSVYNSIFCFLISSLRFYINNILEDSNCFIP